MAYTSEYCPICNFLSKITHGPHEDYIDVDCPKCGKFRTMDVVIEAFDFINNKDEIPIISHWVRKNQDGINFIELDEYTITKILSNNHLPSLSEQTENLIRLIGDSVKKPDAFYRNSLAYIASIIGSYDGTSVRYIIDHLSSVRLIKGFLDSSPDAQIYLTFSGWELYDQIKKTSIESDFAFMAMQYNDDTLENVYKDYLKPSVKQTGFDLRRLDERLKAGLIDDQLRIEIRKCRFLIADLTHGNYGSYWEAGFAEGLGKPVIYLCQKKVFDEKKTHFDTNHLTTITWETETLEKDMERLKATIRTTFYSEAKLNDD